MTDQTSKPDGDAIDIAVDFKKEYQRLEDSITRDREAEVALGTLRTRLLQYIDGKIPFGDHSIYLLFTAFPSLATKIVKNRCDLLASRVMQHETNRGTLTLDI
jgi:hypothetical protein